MKQKFLTLLFVLLVLALLTACSAAVQPTAPTQPETASPADTAPSTPTEEPAPTAEAAPPAPADPAAAAPASQDTPVTQTDAEAIALEHAGATADQVKFLHSEYEIDDRIPQYDVEFYYNNTEYNYEIHAETGEILSFERDD